MKQSLNKILNQLQLIENKSVFFRDENNGENFNGFSSEVKNKIDFIQPDAFYVFNNTPLILFFDLTNGQSKVRLKEIHKQVWSFDHSPIIFIVNEKEIEVFNAFSYDKEQESLQKLKLSENDILEKFSFWNLESGKIWTEYFEDKKSFQAKKTLKRANHQLFNNIKSVREKLTDSNLENFLPDNIANTLILRLIFIRYLIDRGVKINDELITGDSVLEKRKSFSKLISETNGLNQLFNQLNDRFNGVLFKDDKINLTEIQSSSLSDIFAGETPEKGSLFYEGDFYFEVFDFSIIPVEVISGIYESLIDPETRIKDAAVYTPSFLVEYILNDTVVPFLEANQVSECSIFDPSVGSGIFLVQSLRRMIEKEIDLNGNEDNNLFSQRIREIAVNNLFGIDINESALKVTCFSIYIALLDYQDPKDINIYQFPNLIGKNLFESNFFNTKHEFNKTIKDKKVDFLLGNPPWKSDDDPIHTEWIQSNKIKVGNKEIAQSFLLRSKDFMAENTRSTLIVTSTMFFNVASTTKTFKNRFLTTFCIDKFLDLSPVRHLIFEEKDSPAMVVSYHLPKSDNCEDQVVKHHSVKWNKFLKYLQMLVIEKYDQKEILQKYFIENDWMFKVALYGNTLDFYFLKSISSLALIKDKLEIKGRDGFKRDRLSKLSVVNLDRYITEKKEIKPYYTPCKTIFFSENVSPFFGDKRIILKGQTINETDIIVSFSENKAIFRNDTFLVTSENINVVYSVYISDLYKYYIYLISCTWGVSTRPAVRLSEYLNFPIITFNNKINKDISKLVNDFIEPIREFSNQELPMGEMPVDHDILQKINAIINNEYNVTPLQKDLIDYTLEIARYQFQENKIQKIIKPVHNDIETLKKYASVYIEEFSKIYANENFKVEIYPLDHFVAMNFILTSKKVSESNKIIIKNDTREQEILKRLSSNLSIDKITNATDSKFNLYVQKDIKGFEKDSFYIIKPNEFQCWHRATAWYDVAEFKQSIEEAEISQINADFDGF